MLNEGITLHDDERRRVKAENSGQQTAAHTEERCLTSLHKVDRQLYDVHNYKRAFSPSSAHSATLTASSPFAIDSTMGLTGRLF